jgi:hypothetical protein
MIGTTTKEAAENESFGERRLKNHPPGAKAPLIFGALGRHG